MLYQVTGCAGSGKTEYLYGVLEQAFLSGESCVWISPEQQSVQAEREILSRLGDRANLSVEILNFERLPERVARAYGDVAVTYPDKGALCALLSVLAHAHRRELQEYAAMTEDEAFIEGLFGLFGRLRSECIPPSKLQEVLQNGSLTDAHLRNKLQDIALLYAAYDAYFAENRRDARDALTVLASELQDKPFFAGKTVFVDGYFTFTGQEEALLAQIIKQAKDVYCTFCLDDRDPEESDWMQPHRTCAFRLARLASQHRKIEVGAFCRSAVEELRFLETHLWSSEQAVFSGSAEALRIVDAPDLFSESEAVASEILRLTRLGYRYREITVLARNADSYAGVLDAVLAQNHIPFFFSQKDELLTRPLCAFLCATMELITTDFSAGAMRRYFKSGYSGLEPNACDLLLRYAESWHLRGEAWVTPAPWTRNPDGYVEGGMNEEQEALLAAVNAQKALVQPGFASLREELLRATNGRELLTALYAHLTRVGAQERFTLLVNDLLARGENEQAKKDSQLWKLLMRIFGQMDEQIGTQPLHGKAGIRRLLSLFNLIAKQYDLGSIPSSLDSVTVGSAALCRPDRARAVILMGCNDGVFPASVGRDPLFDDNEAILLEGEGLTLVESREARLQEERFYFYYAATSASEQLVLTYPTGTLTGEELLPSPAIARIRALFPQAVYKTYTGVGAQALFSPENASLAFYTLPEGEERDRLQALLRECGISVSQNGKAISDPQAQIVYPHDTVRFSPSSVERYRYCPFSYFGQHLLKLKEKKVNRFASQELGTFLHKMLEEFLRAHTVDGRFVPPESFAETEREADRMIETYLRSVADGEELQNNRFARICRNMKQTLLQLLADLCEEFAGSSFLPVGFEVGIGLPGSAFPAVVFPFDDGLQVAFRGCIDRVDLYTSPDAQYARVVDYKTYQKDFSFAMSEQYGLDQQMLLYLFAFCKVASAPGAEPIRPAGVLYTVAALPFVKSTGAETEEALEKERCKKKKRSGLILQDTSVALAMDPNATGKFLPASFDKNGELKPGAGTLSTGQFINLRVHMREQLIETARQVHGGDMRVAPKHLGESHDACTYCGLRMVCRHKQP